MCKPAEHYRLPRRIQYPEFIGKVILIISAIIISCVMYASYKGVSWMYNEYVQADHKVAMAEASRNELLSVLEGREIMHEKGDFYGKVAKVEWTMVEEVKQ